MADGFNSVFEGLSYGCFLS